MTHEEAFNQFWRSYPRRVGKGDARKAFAKAIKMTDMPTILEAIDRYKSQKPDWMHFKHPATWLRQECWEDEWETPQSDRYAQEAAAWIANAQQTH